MSGQFTLVDTFNPQLTRSFHGADLVWESMRMAQRDGAVEDLQAKLNALVAIVGNLLDHAPLTPEQKLVVCELQYVWEVAK